MREKLLDLLQQGRELANEMCGEQVGCEKCLYQAPKGCAFGFIADYLIANGVTVQKWIPASEPPKEPGIYQVLGYDKDWEITKVWYGQFSGYDWFVYDIYGDGKRFDVTHWMPLPEPPKGEEKC